MRKILKILLNQKGKLGSIYKDWYKDRRDNVYWWYLLFRKIYRVIHNDFSRKLWKFFRRLKFIEWWKDNELRKVKFFINNSEAYLKNRRIGSCRKKLKNRNYLSFVKYLYAVNLSMWLSIIIIILLIILFVFLRYNFPL